MLQVNLQYNNANEVDSERCCWCATTSGFRQRKVRTYDDQKGRLNYRLGLMTAKRADLIIALSDVANLRFLCTDNLNQLFHC